MWIKTVTPIPPTAIQTQFGGLITLGSIVFVQIVPDFRVTQDNTHRVVATLVNQPGVQEIAIFSGKDSFGLCLKVCDDLAKIMNGVQFESTFWTPELRWGDDIINPHFDRVQNEENQCPK